MVKAPGYTDNEYEATKARLNQKYGGNRRQVQAHLDELRKMMPINADNPRELERFTNIVERTVVSLKENNKFANLEGETLYAIVLEKLGTDSVELTDTRTDTISYFMRRK